MIPGAGQDLTTSRPCEIIRFSVKCDFDELCCVQTKRKVCGNEGKTGKWPQLT